MDKNSAMEGLLVQIKKGVVKRTYQYQGLFSEGQIYRIKSIKGSRATLVDPETNKIIGDVVFSHIEISSRENLADTMAIQASEMIERAKLLMVKSEKLKKFRSDEEEISHLIEKCITDKLSASEILDVLKENQVELKFKV